MFFNGIQDTFIIHLVRTCQRYSKVQVFRTWEVHRFSLISETSQSKWRFTESKGIVGDIVHFSIQSRRHCSDLSTCVASRIRVWWCITHQRFIVGLKCSLTRFRAFQRVTAASRAIIMCKLKIIERDSLIAPEKHDVRSLSFLVHHEFPRYAP